MTASCHRDLIKTVACVWNLNKTDACVWISRKSHKSHKITKKKEPKKKSQAAAACFERSIAEKKKKLAASLQEDRLFNPRWVPFTRRCGSISLADYQALARLSRLDCIRSLSCLALSLVMIVVSRSGLDPAGIKGGTRGRHSQATNLAFPLGFRLDSRRFPSHSQKYDGSLYSGK